MHNDSFFVLALIYLAAAVVVVPLAKRLGMVSILGYLLAGVLIGPFMLGLIGEEGQDVMHFAEFGVVMMLFVIGLELDPSLLWRMRSLIAGLGGLQLLLSTAIISSIAMLLGLEWQAALALGMILSLSSTALVLQMFSEKGGMKSAAGQSSFSVLLFQDIAVIPILAIMPLLATLAPVEAAGEGHQNWVDSMPAWTQTILVLGVVAAIVAAGRTFLPMLFRVIARTRLPELFTASVLLLVIGISLLMSQLGVSPALGAFVAGVVLANSEYRHELESDIAPFKGLLLAVFFISVGASIDFGLIGANPLRILSLVVVLILVKSSILFLLGKLFRMGTDQNVSFSLALAQGGEFAFVLLSYAGNNGILSPDIMGSMVAVVSISMALTPVVMMLNDRFILPVIGTRTSVNVKEADAIEHESPVIIAGFGHFGSTVGRMLKASGIEPVVLDFDSDRVEALRRLGFRVYYGDASRYDLLKTAGADKAQIIVIALDNPEVIAEMVDTISKHFPRLQILARARNRVDAYTLMDKGLIGIYRESIDTSVRLGQDVLKILGQRAHSVHRAGILFRKLDDEHMKRLATLRFDQKIYISAAKELIRDLEEAIQTDKEVGNLEHDRGWDSDSLRDEIRGRKA
jgi:monovalent cation:H+ antiporter-2, CPA2 family